jgi:polyisoprenoid-binding protein YceI
MKKLNFVIALFLFTSTLFAQSWTVDKGHSKVAFIVGHHGISEVDGYFKKYEATLTATKEDLSDATFEMTVETASITTDLDMRDNHLRSEDIFNVEKMPTMTFKSTSLKKKKKNQYIMVGDLTLRGVTKQVTLDVTMNGPVENPNKGAKNFQVGIKALGKIKRSDFVLGAKLPAMFVSDEIQLRVTGEFSKPNPNAK